MIGETARAGHQPQLRERDLEIGTVDELFSRVRQRRGRRLLIQGPAGIGKSALLEAAVDRAERQGFICLTAVAPEVGAHVAFAVAREALGPRWPTPDPIGAEIGSGPGSRAINIPELQAAAQVVLDLAEERPLLVCVDDVQWADPASLRWLTLLTERLHAAPVGIVLGIRSGGPAPEGDLATLLDDRRAIVVRPAPLSPLAAGEVVGEVLGVALSTPLAAVCREQTGGNPYLLSLLAAGLRQSGVDPTRLDAAQLAEIGASGVTESVRRQLSALDPDSRAVADTVAAVGDIGTVARIAEITAISASETIDAVGRLRLAGLLREGRTLEFIHPLVAAAVRRQLPAATLIGRVRAAADILLAAGQLEEAAALLLDLPPQGEDEIAATLLGAADRALGRGAPDVAITLLERAVSEPPAEPLIAEVWLALGRAQVLCDDPRGVRSLQQAVELISDAARVAGLAHELASALERSSRSQEAVDALHAARDRLSDEAPELAEELDIAALHYSILSPAHVASRPAEIASWRHGRRALTEFGHRLILSELTHESVMAGERARDSAALAERALAGGTLLTRSLTHHLCAAVDLAYAGEPGLARGHLNDEMTYARRAGDVVFMAGALVLRGETRRLEGDMVATEVDARTGLELLPHGERGPRFMTRGLIEALAHQGRTEEAAELLRVYDLAGELWPIIPSVGLLQARAMVRRQQGALNTALEDLLRSGEIAELVGMRNAWVASWRVAAVEILHELGELGQARELADEQLALARGLELDEAVGVALRARARLSEGEPAHAMLTEAVGRLEAGTARYELAVALIDLGASGLGLGRDDGRSTLERGTSPAAELGASHLAADGERQLMAAGIRPRGVKRRGAQSLTASEQRAARLAAEGLTNREIARTLVLSEKTIETHLASTFRKLGIRSRLQLADLIDVGVEGQGFSG